MGSGNVAMITLQNTFMVSHDDILFKTKVVAQPRQQPCLTLSLPLSNFSLLARLVNDFINRNLISRVNILILSPLILKPC